MGHWRMKFHPTPIEGVVEVFSQWHRDARGDFGRVFCRREFAAHGLNPDVAQCSRSNNPHKGTVRGFHLQAKPHQEAKLVQCVHGRIYDVALDLPSGSPTFGLFHAVELSASDGRMLYIPEGCAHSFQTLEDDSTIIYHVSAFYEPSFERGVRWNDPAVGVRWPLADQALLNERDRSLPLLSEYKADS